MNKVYQKSLFIKKNVGFTLIELLVVVLIIGILAAVALPQYTKAVEKSRAAQALAVLKSFGQANLAYYMANGQYPVSFEQLDIDMHNWTGREAWYRGATDTRSNGDWSLQIINEGESKNQGVYVGRLTGAYKGGGFAIYTVRLNNGKTDNIVCLERTSEGVVFEKAAGDYCQKLFQATLAPSQQGFVRTYNMP